ncbi:hypothetical protein KP509_01G041800 [Ceratopteris richardii]|uniref:Uncharacterized protein n=1 Tax=Ceratopteris richardii TaxID=49495 RepID=A0A8T2VKN1_CERRI|nr:hypothetical protein KP509_01G041800 [Ceratopteris richardii]
MLPCLHAWKNLMPPVGNSLAIKTKTRNGVQFYRCLDGEWLPESAYAGLTSFYDTRHEVESGDLTSLVSGKQFLTATGKGPRDLPDFLAVATMHKNRGEASLVSYIARVNTKGGVPIKDGACRWEGKLIKLPFEAEFHFWKQDMIPPTTPPVLSVASGRAIQGVYGQGIVTYAFDGSTWRQRGINAELYDVPGGNKMGTHFTKVTVDSKGGSFCWQFDGPNEVVVVGKHACEPVQVTPGSLPWSLNEVTTSTGKLNLFGNYTHVQMVSTTGGLPPMNTAEATPRSGQIYKSSFTAIYWIYCAGD